MKIIAFYLPQFHTIPENDEWWGKGFTEWTNVKRAKPLYKGHEQPQVPLNNNYYDLSLPETLKWQADLAKQYNVYGMCFYHYWFNGKLLLEKPAENLLANKDIDMRFCFSWANEPWARTWDGKNRNILMAQTYGDRESWKQHFNYILPFFQDSRYIFENNKPMFVIYKTESIDKCKEMMDYWIELAKENGLNGIHFVETIRSGKLDSRDLPIEARVEFEPGRITNNVSVLELFYNRIKRYTKVYLNILLKTKLLPNPKQDFQKIAKESLATLSPKGTYGGVFAGWDNSPRKRSLATIIEKPTETEFANYLSQKIEITRSQYKTDMVFINAWNEWCEGTYLEPDERHKFQYLEVIKKVVK